MKQVVLDPRRGSVTVVDVPVPSARPGMLLVRNRYSVVSPGTERLTIDLGRKGLVQKALARPDLVREVLHKARRDGAVAAVRESLRRLDAPIALGYSSSGVVAEVGPGVDAVRVGDAVACAGAGFASHAEFVTVPQSLCVPVPAGVALDQAAFAMMGAIALHGVRRTEPQMGETVVVMGLGLLGQLTLQLLHAGGCRTVAIDVDPARVGVARTHGAGLALTPEDDVAHAVATFTHGVGADAVVITAATGSNAPIDLAASISRRRGRLVMVGVTGMRIPRRPFWEKELELRLSRAAGPGSEETSGDGGASYPLAYVRWTAGRNLAAFLELVQRGQITLETLITHRIPIERADEAYALILGDRRELYLGILLTHPSGDAEPRSNRIALPPARTRPVAGVGVSVIGAGLFGRTVLIPALRRLSGVRLRGLATATGISAHHLGRRLGFAYATTDADTLLSDADTEAIVIATRHDLHAPLVARALDAGKHVFVEKPLALSEDDLDLVLAAYRRSPRVLIIGFNRRFSPLVAELKTALGAHRPLTMVYRINAGIVPADHWVYDPREGGGRWLSEGGHFIDLLQHLTAATPREVYARAQTDGHASSPVILITFDDGSLGTIVYVDGADMSYSREQLEVFAPGVAATLDDFRHLVISRDRRVRRQRRWMAQKGHREELQAWLRAVRGETGPPVRVEDYVTNALATFAVLRSIHTGRPEVVQWEVSHDSRPAV